MTSDKEKQIIDIVCAIPVEQWDNKSADNALQTLFKGKAIRLIRTWRPDGTNYVTINIDGINFGGDANKKCIEMVNKIIQYVDAQNRQELLDKIEDIWKRLTS